MTIEKKSPFFPGDDTFSTSICGRPPTHPNWNQRFPSLDVILSLISALVGLCMCGAPLNRQTHGWRTQRLGKVESLEP